MHLLWSISSYYGYFSCYNNHYPLMDLRLLIIEMPLWHVTAVIVVIDLMQLRSENIWTHFI
jgi:hypothetical protein